MKSNIRNLFTYNLQRNKLLHNKLTTIKIYNDNINTQKDYLYFNSIKGTFNHIFLANLLWYMRINQLTVFNLKDVIGNDNNMHNQSRNLSLDNIKYEDLVSLWKADTIKFHDYFKYEPNWTDNYIIRHEFINSLIIKHIDGIKDKEFLMPITYKNLKGDSLEKILIRILHHLINHETHHIGQISTVMCELSKKDLPGLDYSYFL